MTSLTGSSPLEGRVTTGARSLGVPPPPSWIQLVYVQHTGAGGDLTLCLPLGGGGEGGEGELSKVFVSVMYSEQESSSAPYFFLSLLHICCLFRGMQISTKSSAYEYERLGTDRACTVLTS